MTVSPSPTKKRKVSHEETMKFLFYGVKTAFQEEPQKYQQFLDIMAGGVRSGLTNDSLHRLSRKLQTLFSAHPHLAQGMNRYLPQPYQIQINHNHLDHDDEEQVLRPIVEFVDAVKLTFRDQPEKFNRFLDILNSYRKGLNSDLAVISREIWDLFNGHPDLQEAFPCIVSPPQPPNPQHEDDDDQIQGLALCQTVETHHPHAYKKFKTFLAQHSNKLITGVEFQMSVSDLVHDSPIVMHQLAAFLQAGEDSAARRRRREKVNGDFHEKSTQHADLPDDKSWNPSYRRLLNPTQPVKTEDEVLNHSYLLVRRDDEFAHQHHSSEEQERRDRREDIHYELDMLVNAAKSAAARAEEELEVLKSGTEPGYKVRFSGLNLKCIKMIYGDFGEDVVRLILENPLPRLPTIIHRLNQKEREWKDALDAWRARN